MLALKSLTREENHQMMLSIDEIEIAAILWSRMGPACSELQENMHDYLLDLMSEERSASICFVADEIHKTRRQVVVYQ